MAGNGPLAVNSTTTSMYFFDMNYHWIRWRLNQFDQLQSQTYQPASYTTQSGTSIVGGDAYAFDAADVLYTVAHDASSAYLVAHAENTGTPIITALNVPPSQVFDMESAVKTYPAPVGPGARIAGVATGRNGTVLAALYGSNGPDDTLVQILENGTNCCAFVASSDVGRNVNPQYFRGGNGLASCITTQVYWLGINGNVVRITL